MWLERANIGKILRTTAGKQNKMLEKLLVFVLVLFSIFTLILAETAKVGEDCNVKECAEGLRCNIQFKLCEMAPDVEFGPFR